MADFKFLRIPSLEEWVVLAPRRAGRPHVEIPEGKFCPFCPGNEKRTPEVFRIGGEDNDSNWKIRVVPNKYPFAPIHEIVILTPEHHKHFSDLTLDEICLVIESYVNRYNTHLKQGTVCIFHNSGHEAGESVAHLHSQIAVVPRDIQIVVPQLELDITYRGEYFIASEFTLICPPFSQWPDEVWIVPRERGKLFGEIMFEEIEKLAFVFKRLVRILELRHGEEFPYNFYIYPYRDWYIRIMPRAKIPGGFEMATGIFVNTQDPHETMEFIKAHFAGVEEEKIKKSRAQYRRGV